MNLSVQKVEEKRHIYGRPRSATTADRKRQHKTVEVCVIGAVEIIGQYEMVNIFIDKVREILHAKRVTCSFSLMPLIIVKTARKFH